MKKSRLAGETACATTATCLLSMVLHSGRFIAGRDDLVGRAPWPAADPLVGHLRRVHSSLWLRLCCLVGQAVRLAVRLPSAACGRFFHSSSRRRFLPPGVTVGA